MFLKRGLSLTDFLRNKKKKKRHQQEEKHKKTSMVSRLRVHVPTLREPLDIPFVLENGSRMGFDELQAHVMQYLPENGPAFVISYTDSDGDNVTVGTDTDLKELSDLILSQGISIVDIQVKYCAAKNTTNSMQESIRSVFSSVSSTFARTMDLAGATSTAAPTSSHAVPPTTAQTSTNAAIPTVAGTWDQVMEQVLNYEIPSDQKHLEKIKELFLVLLTNIELREAFLKISQEKITQEEEEEETSKQITESKKKDKVFVEKILHLFNQEKPDFVGFLNTNLVELLGLIHQLNDRCPSVQPVMKELVLVLAEAVYHQSDCTPKQKEEDERKMPPPPPSCLLQQEDFVKYGNLEHTNFVCDGCKIHPIRGVRFRSKTKNEVDLCSLCYQSGRFEEIAGPFDKITRVFSVHHGVVCDGCKMTPIIGNRFKSFNHRNVDFCEQCEASGQFALEYEPFIKITDPSKAPSNQPLATPPFVEQFASNVPVASPLVPVVPVVPAPLVDPFPAPVASVEPIELQASFAKDENVPDGSVFAPGARFVKKWRIKNEGEHAWPQGCSVIMQGDTTVFGAEAAYFSYPLCPLKSGEETSVEVPLCAPFIAGRYTAYWRVCDPSGEPFGHRLWVDIVVAEENLHAEATIAQETSFQPVPHATIQVTNEIPVASSSSVAASSSAPLSEQQFTDELSQLTTMGFSNIELNKTLLNKFNGNVGDVINSLLST
jgi:hypothetical protein